MKNQDRPTLSVPETKIKIARELNISYNLFCAEREEHEKKWKEILSVCFSEGISPDLIQVTPDIFNFIVERNVAKQYFK